MRASSVLFLVTAAALLSACASTGKQALPDPFDSVSDLLDHSAGYSQQELIHKLYIRDANGEETPYRARVQFVVINALTSVSSWANRRSHDKLIIKDGTFPGRDMIITGGRNISVDYYGINKEGSRNPDTYLDRVYPERDEDDEDTFGVRGLYAYEPRKAQRALAFVKNVPAIKETHADLPSFLSEGYHISKVRLRP